MIDAVLKKIFGTKHERDVKRAMPVVAQITALEPAMQALDDAALRGKTDELRKRLSGVSPLHRLGPEGYSSEMSERVYATIAERARLTIREGHSAIVDSVYARPVDRQAIEQVAANVAVPFVGIWLEAPEDTLITRAEQRRNDATVR